MRHMIQYINGERRVIDTDSMTASEFLTQDEAKAPLADYELDCELNDRDIDPAINNFIVIRS